MADSKDPLEIWGGFECSVNRVGDTFTDQLAATGHDRRLDDLDRIAQLGISALRYPVLWERVSPDRPDQREWAWSDERLARLRALDLRPILGLVHHGSGPHYVDLLSDDFAPGLAAHAGAVAARYPWVEDWIPVNEPLTTARFSALYGHWYPHHRDERSFWTALLNQIDGVRLSMRAIRAVNARARLIQTDDLGRTFATARLRDQGAFDNTRRWMGWDLLFGRVVPGHPFWGRLVALGFEDRLRAIADDPCPPDIVGLNHYLTSDRFLDHRVRHYPPERRGGSESQAYADLEAIRVLDPAPPGLSGALQEAWARYGVPVAVTEVHNGCTREEQMRWLSEAWQAAARLRGEGADIRAITIWALVGTQGWDRLLTGGGRYEPGVFDVRGSEPRATGLATMIRRLTAAEPEPDPLVAGQGWWRRPIRLNQRPVRWPAKMDAVRPPGPSRQSGMRILIAGATGTLGRALSRACDHRDLAHVLLSRAEMDIASEWSIAQALELHQPDLVINAAGWVRVDDAEENRRQCFIANAVGAARLARSCARRGIATISFSSDLVFGGGRDTLYREEDETAPLNVYGRSKAAAERWIGRLPGRHLVVRTAAFFSPFDPHNFAAHLVRALQDGRPFAAATDQVVSPTYVPHLCDAVLDLAIDEAEGLWHLSNNDALSWHDFGRAIARRLDLDPALVQPARGADLGWRAPRPDYCALATRGELLPSLEEAIGAFAAVTQADRATLSEPARRACAPPLAPI